MPYCPRCGKEVSEEVRFCPDCGASLRVSRRARERRFPSLGILSIVLIVVAVIVVTLGFSPVRTVDKSWTHSASYSTGVDTFVLDFRADVCHVRVSFEDLADKLVILDAWATARAGLFVSPDVLERFRPFSTLAIEGNVLTATVTQDVDAVDLQSLNVTCLIRVDRSLNATVDILTKTGGIRLNTMAGVILNSVSLEATTGGVSARLVEDVVVSGDVSAMTTTGGVELSWDNVIVSEDVLVSAITTTGGVAVGVRQDREQLWNVTVEAEATTGGVAFAIDVGGDVGAKIDSSVTTGGIDVDRQVGFSLVYSYPERAGLISDNHPAKSNFDVGLRTTTGGIKIDATYTP